MRVEDYGYGIQIGSSLGLGKYHVMICDESDFWDWSDESKLKALDSANAMGPYVVDAELIGNWPDSIKGNIGNGFVRADTIARLSANPFLSDELKARTLFEWEHRRIPSDPATRRFADKPLKNKVVERDQSTCRYCGIKLELNEINIDHVIPYSKGGKTVIENLVVSCVPCNMRKFNKSLEESSMTLLEVSNA
jgi:5-methylcytosine-specific restriction endonuclease McrA